MLEIIHEGHLGVEKCKRRARKVLYWLNMNNDIEELASRYETCNIHQSSQTKDLGADLFNLNGQEFLLVIDYYSNYPEVALLEETSSKAVINKLKSIFSRHGIPSKLITDNGRQFISSEFKSFTDYYNINHSTSSPTFARSNGIAEKGVGIVKKLLKKAAEKGEDQYLAMLDYRAAPLDWLFSSRTADEQETPNKTSRLRRSAPISKNNISDFAETGTILQCWCKRTCTSSSG